MRLSKRKTATSDHGKEQVAARIAAQIIRWQCSLSEKINNRVNRFTKTGQKKFLWLFCVIWIAVVCFNLFRSRGQSTIHAVKPNFLPTHIGQAFDIPRPKPIQATDSLTIKK